MDVGSENRPPMLEKGSYVPWASRFMRYVDGKKEHRRMDPLALVANTYASPSYSQPSQSYYVTHPPLVKDMMMIIKERQDFRVRLRIVVGMLEGMLGIKEIMLGMVLFRKLLELLKMEQMLITTKDEAEIHLDDEENDFMLMSAIGDNQLEELNASVIVMARLQPADNDSDAEPTYDSDFRTYVDDQLDNNIMLDDPYVEVNGGQAKHAFGKYLEEEHVTWARFGKKLDKNITLQAYDFHSNAFTKSAQKVEFLLKVVTSQVVETASRFSSYAIRMHGDGVNTKSDGVTLADKEKAIEDLAG
ncbi:hypothetical protein Tco_0723503 [Tanacetum coccineum]